MSAQKGASIMPSTPAPGTVLLLGFLVIGITLFLGTLKRDNLKIALALIVIAVILVVAWNSFQAQFGSMPPFKILP